MVALGNDWELTPIAFLTKSTFYYFYYKTYKMKKILFFLMFPLLSFGQYTSIPDSIFELRLINLGIDSIYDGQVLTANIINIDSLDLSVAGAGPGSLPKINDLTGIEGFLNLTFLNCSNNNFTNLDLSQNSSLEYLICEGGFSGFFFFIFSNGQITDINLPQNSSLNFINCSRNKISHLDLSQSSSITYLDCSDNRIFNLDLGLNPNLDTLICRNNNLLTLDVSQCTGLKNLMCNNVSFGPWGGGPSSTNNLTYLDLSQNISLENLDCSDNNISYLDLSQNVNLTDLDCSGNNLTNINISQNYALRNLTCDDNQILELDVSNDTLLTTLICGSGGGFISIGGGNNLKTLDVSQNPNLEYLDCSNNELKNLDLRNGNNSNLTFFRCRNNDSLNCISVNDTIWADTNWNNNWTIGQNSSIVFSSNCPFVDIYTAIPDSMFEQKLISLGYDSIHDGQVLTSNIRNIDSLDVSNAGIIDLTGIKDFISLSFLNCNLNELAIFDISQNTLLENLQCRCSGLDFLDLTQNSNLSILDCNNDIFTGSMPCQNSDFNNNISYLNLSKNPYLSSISAKGNDLINLDLSQNANLTEVQCQNNSLVSLDIRNGNNTNLTYFNAVGNDSLFCIASDDSVWSNNNLTNIPIHAFFSNYCTNYYTYIPDLVFEQNLINLGYDINIDGKVLTSSIVGVDSLFLDPIGAVPWTAQQISDLKGIEDFINLTYLNSPWLNLDSLDFSQNPNLKYLSCSGVPWFQQGLSSLSSINLSQNTDLTHLIFNFCQVNNIDLSQNSNLSYLECPQNQLNSLDVSQNVSLDTLICSYNQLNSLDVSQNPNLLYLECRNNLISNLDVSQNSSLAHLECRNNERLSNLDLRNGNNVNFTFFSARNNDSLYCISVDDSVWSANNWLSQNSFGLSNIDEHNFFSNDCNDIPYEFTYIPDSIFEEKLIAQGYDNIYDKHVFTFNINSLDSLDVSSGFTANVRAYNPYYYSNGYSGTFFGIDGALYDANPMLFSYGNPISIQLNGVTYNYFINYVTQAYSSFSGNQHDNVRHLYLMNSFGAPVNIFGNLTINDTYSIDSDPSEKIQDLTGIQDFDSLKYLRCGYNLISNLNLSENRNLTSLNCENNQLNCLNLRNGNNINVDYINGLYNPNLSCIEVDDSSYSMINWTDTSWTFFDSNIYFSKFCNNSCSSCFVEIENNHSTILIASTTVGTFQWLDCNNNYAPINGATNQYYTAISNGDYAVERTNGVCVDTSECYSINNVGIIFNGSDKVKIYPNPTQENITISIEGFNGNFQTEVFDIIGNKLQTTNETTISLRDYTKGIYILKVAYVDRVDEVKVIKD